MAALFAATFANAQITLLQTFNTYIYASAERVIRNQVSYVQAPYLFSFVTDGNGSITINLYNTDDLSLYKTANIHLNSSEPIFPFHISQNILTTDNKTCFILASSSGNTSYIYNEDAQLVTTINGTFPTLYRADDQYLLLTYTGDDTTHVYSLPGNGEATDVSEVTTPRHSARKYMQNEQVLIDSNDRTYNIQGQEVR